MVLPERLHCGTRGSDSTTSSAATSWAAPRRVVTQWSGTYRGQEQLYSDIFTWAGQGKRDERRGERGEGRLMGSATARRAAHLRSTSSAPVSCARAHCGTQTSNEGRARRQRRRTTGRPAATPVRQSAHALRFSDPCATRTDPSNSGRVTRMARMALLGSRL